MMQRGDGEDMARVLTALDADDSLDDADRQALLGAMRSTTTRRKVTPEGGGEVVVRLLGSERAGIRNEAIALAGLWKVDAATEALKSLVADAQTDNKTRERVIDSLMSLDRTAAKEAVLQMTAESQPAGMRRRGLRQLVPLDVQAASKVAAGLLVDVPADGDPLPVVRPFLEQQGGPQALAAAMSEVALSEAQAKNILSKLSAIGSADASITAAVMDSAGLGSAERKWSPEEIAAVAARIPSEGDAARGEEIFRREALNCFKCHQVNKAGGNIGPELSAVGVTSPYDYLIKALIYPSADVKEAWVTRLVRTVDGQIVSGMVVSEDDDLLKLKDAQGKITEIPVDDIDAEKEGDSLMPQGLTKFLSDAEFIDLVAYLKALGSPDSPYAVRSSPRVQRWAVLPSTDYNGQAAVPGDDALRKMYEAKWAPFYAKANGDVPLGEIARITNQSVVYLLAEAEVSEETPVWLNLAGGRDGIVAIVGEKVLETTGRPAASLQPGRNRIMLRVDLRERESPVVGLTLEPQNGGNVTVVDGE